MRLQPMSLHQKCNLVTLYFFGMKLQAIGAHYGICHTTVSRIVKDMGYKSDIVRNKREKSHDGKDSK